MFSYHAEMSELILFKYTFKGLHQQLFSKHGGYSDNLRWARVMALHTERDAQLKVVQRICRDPRKGSSNKRKH